jgi:hypothetical protein
MTQTRRSWQIRVPMGGTVHRDRSNTRRSLSTSRQEDRKRREQPVECGTTPAFLCIRGVWQQELSSYDLLNPEHEATGWVLWVQLDNIYKHVSIFPLGGSDPRVV